jgi:inward rectifier potassium channel
LAGLTFVRFSRPRAKLIFAANPVVAMHNDKPTFTVRIGNGRAGVLADAAVDPSVLLSETSGRQAVPPGAGAASRAGAHSELPTLLDCWTRAAHYTATVWRERSRRTLSIPNARSARPTLATLVHEIRTYAAEDTRFGMRYTDAATKEEDGTPVLDLTRIGALEPDNGDQQEQGWTEREEERE